MIGGNFTQYNGVSRQRIARIHADGSLDTTFNPGLGPNLAVSQLALQANDPLALQALELFCGFLGSVAGNLALTLGARGGVFIGGGVVPRLGTWFDQSPFRPRFEAKGRFAPYLASIPCWIIDPSATPALYGASRALDIAGA